MNYGMIMIKRIIAASQSVCVVFSSNPPPVYDNASPPPVAILPAAASCLASNIRGGQEAGSTWQGKRSFSFLFIIIASHYHFLFCVA
ncbi:hypothetical protein E2C01_064092 [Portunus trituberculatus]|uniref:Uncharacterized protein n=1 Tax=Portunus trituberculatus TaxID=210409 RepID=A0A5B7HC60_PORTR|nr:hypothetical protein [Portunus trituberculatus]